MNLKPFNPKHHNPGLAQGFVRFGTVAHAVLKFIFEYRTARHRDIVEEGIAENGATGMCLTQLRRYGYITKINRAGKYETGDWTQAVYAITGTAWPANKREKYRNIAQSERQARCRNAKKLKVATIFDFKGVMPCQIGNSKSSSQTSPLSSATSASTHSSEDYMKMWRLPKNSNS